MRRLLEVLITWLILISPGYARDNVTVDVELDGYSGYIWRGYVIGADDRLVLQPNATLTVGESGLSAGAWGSWFTSRSSMFREVDEVDLWIDYSRSLGKDSPMSISAGFTEYLYPNAAAGERNSEEAYLGFSLDNSFTPSLTYYYDFGLADAWYLVLAGGINIPLGNDEGPALNLSASIAASDYEGETGFNDVTTTASVTFPLGRFSITPEVGLTFADGKVNDKDVTFWGGVSVGTTFGSN